MQIVQVKAVVILMWNGHRYLIGLLFVHSISSASRPNESLFALLEQVELEIDISRQPLFLKSCGMHLLIYYCPDTTVI